MRTTHQRLFGAVMAWTLFTSVFAWLPLVRILARPDGYRWSVAGLHGTGTGGPYWIFVVATLFALSLFIAGWRGPKPLFYALLLIWHVSLSTLLVAMSLQAGMDAVWQGQGWGFEIPVPLAAIPFVAFTALAILWVGADVRRGSPVRTAPWTRKNSRRLALGASLLPVAVVLFRLGTDFDAVTALAIAVTIIQWVTLAEAFEPSVSSDDPEAHSTGTRSAAA